MNFLIAYKFHPIFWISNKKYIKIHKQVSQKNYIIFPTKSFESLLAHKKNQVHSSLLFYGAYTQDFALQKWILNWALIPWFLK